MQRTPSSDGPPACWGHSNADDVCSECRYLKSCSAWKEEASHRRTVSQAALDAQQPAELDADMDAILPAIRHLWETAIGKPVWSGQWDPLAFNLNKTLPRVFARCIQAGWDPAIYVRGQVEYLTPLLKSGVPLSVGMFHGPNAEKRFQKWVVQRQSRYGSASVVRTSSASATRERHLAATLQYAHARCIGGATRDVATEEAVGMLPSWKLVDVTESARLQAFSYVLGCLDPSLPHRMLLDPHGTIPSWRDIRRVCDMLRTTNQSDTLDLSALGEVL